MEICFKLCRWYYLLCLYEKVTSAHACKHCDKIKILFVCCVCLFVCLTEMHITDIYAYHFKGSVQS